MMPSISRKREQWLKALSGKDRHSIRNQIIRMTWDAAVFRVVNEARRLAPPAPEGGVQLNGLIHGLLNRGFFATQVTAIRRLIDTNSLEGDFGVYSLTGLLNDLRRYRHLLTRKAIFETEDLPYDYEPIRKEFGNYVSEQGKAGKGAFGIPQELF